MRHRRRACGRVDDLSFWARRTVCDGRSKTCLANDFRDADGRSKTFCGRFGPERTVVVSGRCHLDRDEGMLTCQVVFVENEAFAASRTFFLIEILLCVALVMSDLELVFAIFYQTDLSFSSGIAQSRMIRKRLQRIQSLCCQVFLEQPSLWPVSLSCSLVSISIVIRN